MLLGPELEEFFAVQDSSSRRTSSGTAATRGKRDTHTLSMQHRARLSDHFVVFTLFVGSVSQSVWVDNEIDTTKMYL
jgi:hypothetical protein